jgi:acyl-CoA thioesterase
MMSPDQILHRMYAADPFSQWLGITPVDIQPGACTLRMTVRREMLNGFGVAHGGITFSLADSALAFACNSHGRHAVSIHCTIEHVAPVLEGDELTATATEEQLGNSISNYAIRVTKQDGTAVAFFRGVAYRKKKEWTE